MSATKSTYVMADAFRTRQYCFSRAHLDDCWGVVREGAGNEINRQILGGFACSRSSVDDIAICVLDDRGEQDHGPSRSA